MGFFSTVRSRVIEPIADLLAERPQLHEATSISQDEQAALATLTGYRYTHVLPGRDDDGLIGLVHANGIDYLVHGDHEVDQMFLKLRERSRECSVRPEEHCSLLTYQVEAAKDRATLLRGRTFLYHSDGASQRAESAIDDRSGILATLIKRHDRDDVSGIAVFHRDEAPFRKEWRAQVLQRFLTTLAPAMREQIRFIDFRDPTGEIPDWSGLAQGPLQGIRLRDDDSCSFTAYHEVAHLLSGALGEDALVAWETLQACALESYLQANNLDADRFTTYFRSDAYQQLYDAPDGEARIRKLGYISIYATHSPTEDISELTANIYLHIDEVKRVAEGSPIFQRKIAFLHAHGYIPTAHYRYLSGDGAKPQEREDYCGLAPEADYTLLHRAGRAIGGNQQIWDSLAHYLSIFPALSPEPAEIDKLP